MLRAGGLNVNRSVSVLKSYIRFLRQILKSADDLDPNNHGYIMKYPWSTVMPYR